MRKFIASAGAVMITAALLAGCGALSDANLEDILDSQEASSIIKDTAAELGESAKEAVKEAAKDVAKDIANNAASQLGSTLKTESDKGSSEALLAATSDIKLTNSDGKGSEYTFIYAGETFTAIYTEDNWKVVDSYKIENADDMLIICQALIDEHPVHGKDMVSYRTAEDMVYEWQIHNIAYAFLSDDDPLKAKAKDVDFDPRDQGSSLEEIYYNRTGKELDLNQFFSGN